MGIADFLSLFGISVGIPPQQDRIICYTTGTSIGGRKVGIKEANVQIGDS